MQEVITKQQMTIVDEMKKQRYKELQKICEALIGQKVRGLLNNFIAFAKITMPFPGRIRHSAIGP